MNLARAENSNQLFVFKQLDKFWIIGKHAADAMVVMGEEKFATEYSEAYNSFKSSARNVADYTAMKMNAVDGTLTYFLGSKYTKSKEAVFDIIDGVNENAPQIVKDGIALITLGGAGAAAWKGTKHIVKMTRMPKLASKVDLKGYFGKGGTKADTPS
ncbi:hypothetical protein NOVO_08390 [Rickettsiales bacterium Ac37b]|nr:hypothetical protein NOVO_08390 [Rickettsiales bacterium Ac37b]